MSHFLLYFTFKFQKPYFLQMYCYFKHRNTLNTMFQKFHFGSTGTGLVNIGTNTQKTNNN